MKTAANDRNPTRYGLALEDIGEGMDDRLMTAAVANGWVVIADPISLYHHW